MTERLLGTLVFIFVLSVATAADTYRWEDEEGNVYYSDQSPPPGARNVQRNRQHAGEPEEPLPYRLQVAIKNFPVTLYVSDCGRPCDRARELLLQRGVPHTLPDVSRDETRGTLMALTGGQLEVPVISIGKTVLTGFEAGQWNTALDAAGYPSYPMIKVTPDIPKPAERPVSEASDSGDVETGDVDSGEIEGDDFEAVDVEEDQ